MGIICLIAAATFLSCIFSPPHLMDDVDGAQAQLARNMLNSGDWVTGQLDGVIFLDKAPLKYWITASFYTILGVHDWVARLPSALSVIFLAVVRVQDFQWAGSEEAVFTRSCHVALRSAFSCSRGSLFPDVS